MINIGLLGCGFMGRTHAEIYKLLSFKKDIRLAGVCDTDKTTAESTSRISMSEIFDNADEMIGSDDLDVIDICLPTYLHFEYAKKTILAGKDLFIEKPAVLTLEEAKQLTELKEKHGTKIMVGQCLRFWNEYVALKEINDSKKYGKLKNLTMKRLSQKPLWGFENWYLDVKKSGGVILDLHIHDIDFMRYLLGEPESLYVEGDNNHIYSIFRYNNGTRVQIESGWDYPENFPVETGFRADFEDAVLSYTGEGVTVYENSGKRYIIENIPKNPNDRLILKAHQYGGYYNELEYFVDCLLNSKEIEVNTLDEAIKTIELIYKELKHV